MNSCLVRKKSKLTCGVGIKDNLEPLVRKEFINGKWLTVWRCPYYSKWKDMLMRCYSNRYLSKNPTYQGCKVCDEWLIFSNFKSWMKGQDWHNKCLDKDILINGNKVYSPETCLFVHHKLNTFMCNSKNKLLGVSYHIRDKVFSSNVNNPMTGRSEFLGNFKNEVDAHEAWKNRKLELLKELCDSLNVKPEIYKSCVNNILNKGVLC